MKITIKSDGVEHSIEFDHEGITLPRAIQSFVHLLEAAGYSHNGIVELFNEDGSKENDPFEWEIN